MLIGTSILYLGKKFHGQKLTYAKFFELEKQSNIQQNPCSLYFKFKSFEPQTITKAINRKVEIQPHFQRIRSRKSHFILLMRYEFTVIKGVVISGLVPTQLHKIERLVFRHIQLIL